MVSLSFMAIDKGTGLPIYSRSSSKAEEENKQILFSGIMTAVQNLIKDMDIGILNKITTEAYSIYGKEKGNFFLFFYGEIKKESVIDEILDYIGNFLDYVPVGDDNKFPTDFERYLDGVVDQLFAIYSRENLQMQVYSYIPAFGLESLYGSKDELITMHLINLIRNTIQKEKNQSMIMLDFLTSGAALVVQIIFDEDSGKYILVTIKSDSLSTVDFITYRHKISHLVIEFIKDNKDQLYSSTEGTLVKELAFESFANKIENVLGNLPPKIDYLGMDVLLSMLRKNLPTILTQVTLGNSIYITGDKIAAEQVIALICYVTHVTDGSVEFSDEIPHRLQYVEKGMEGLYDSMGAFHLDLDKNKFRGKTKNKAIEEMIEESLQQDKISEKIGHLQHLFRLFWNDLDDIQKQAAYGVNIFDELKELPAERPKLMLKVLEKVNPHLEKYTNKLAIKPGGINW